MNEYEARQQMRRDRLEAAAERAEDRSKQAFQRADLREEVSGIPLGQPILVRHHSESKHRRAIERADNAMRQAVTEQDRAKELRGKAASVGTGGISSDDPDAIAKLQSNLTERTDLQAFMVAANRVVRAAIKAGITPESAIGDLEPWMNKATEATGKPWGEGSLRNALKPDFCGRTGYADYQLSNNRAQIKRLEQRISQLERQADRETVASDLGICRMVENAELNRLQFIFEGKPDAAIRSTLKSHGFKWAPSVGAWQRKLTPNARYRAGLVSVALRKLRDDAAS